LYFSQPVHVGEVDEMLAGDANVAEVEQLCKVACWCIQDEVGDRPAMGRG
jgi:hypothetical protein